MNSNTRKLTAPDLISIGVFTAPDRCNIVRALHRLPTWKVLPQNE